MSREISVEEKVEIGIEKLNLSRMIGALWSLEDDLYRRRVELEYNLSVNLPHQRISSSQFLQLQNLFSSKEAMELYCRICQQALIGEMLRITSLKEEEIAQVKALQSFGLVFENSKVIGLLKTQKERILKNFKAISSEVFEKFVNLVEKGVVLPRALGVSSDTGLYFVPLEFLSRAYIMNQIPSPFLLGAIQFLIKKARSWDKGLYGIKLWGWGNEKRVNDTYTTCFALRALYNFYQYFGINYNLPSEELIKVISGAISWIVSAQNIEANLERWKRSNWSEEMYEPGEKLSDDGGWGAEKGKASSAESTGLVLLTLKDLEITIEGEEKGYKFLEATAQESGKNMVKWSNRVSDTAFAVLALLKSEKREHKILARKGMRWLFSVQNTPKKSKRITKIIHEELNSLKEEEQKEILGLIMSGDYGWPRAQWGHSRDLQTTIMYNFFTEICCRIDDFEITKSIKNEIENFTKRILSWQEGGGWIDAWNTGFITWDLSTLYQRYSFDDKIRNYIYNALIDCVRWFGRNQHDEYLCWDNPDKPLRSTVPMIGLGHYYNYLLEGSPKIDAHDLLKLAVKSAIKSPVNIG